MANSSSFQACGPPEIVRRQDQGTDREPEWSKAYGRLLNGEEPTNELIGQLMSPTVPVVTKKRWWKRHA